MLSQFILLALASAAPAAADQPAAAGQDMRGWEVFQRTKETRATYAMYAWNVARHPDGATIQGWSAEFHRGTLHRVEAPHVRIVADCERGTGTFLDVATGRSETGAQAAQIACGINSAINVADIQWLGERQGRFGRVDLVRVLDEEHERFYAVDQQGVLVAAQYFARTDAERNCIQAEAVAVEATLPAEDMFSAESLSRSFVPERYQRAPEALRGDHWLGSRRCGDDA